MYVTGTREFALNGDEGVTLDFVHDSADSSELEAQVSLQV